ncbi:MAG: ATP-binding cassette domain-containing protein [Betaproteobacteria bacterium]|jgi:ATP-binding cassette subfamily F protein 3|nr:ATP-binding cassette domain-containing protein [Betaproteobacteria bacterium]MBT7427434.1 ATP-binding cassette domain-containing protein [Betaproteobacteria bacterium]MBT7997852.1 ATP-binding cassette domain-containing protein [Betaproteobacteria bacterium]MDC1433572.1 ATP-binding cassette domain-containing protein [Burkholderiales bacterium]
MISADGLALRRGDKVLFENARFTFYARHKIGITGSNGSGKSSLFALLLGEMQVDSGNLGIQPGLVISHVAQELPAGSQSAIEFVIDGDVELRDVQNRLNIAQRQEDSDQIGTLHERLGAIDGYSAEARANQLLYGLGFAAEEVIQPVDYFSGGWRMRLNLAKALMCRSDLLLLDEPTNHLDLDAVIWLESWLKRFPGTLLLISHDRSFLDSVVQSICFIDSGSLKTYKGNYSSFEVQRASHLAQEKATFVKQQREIDHMRRFVDRFKAKATKARQAQSRMKQLAKLELIAPAHAHTPFNFEFRKPVSRPDPALVAVDVSIGYEETVILENLRFELRSGARIGLLGKNGAGKSTFIRFLAGQIKATQGEVSKSKDLAIGYFEQNSLDQLREDESPLQHMSRIDPYAKEQQLRSYLGSFGFNGDDVFREVGFFSGGERSRLALAIIIWQKPNVLLLDEPTNHLDMEMRYALTLALQSFDGAMVLVSHDRTLLTSVCDQLYLIHDKGLTEFHSDLEDYSAQLLSKTSSAESVGSRSVSSRKERRREEAGERNRVATIKKPLIKKIKVLETQLTRLQAETARLENILAQSDLYDEEQKSNLLEYLHEQASVAREMSQVEEDWLAASTQLENLKV